MKRFMYVTFSLLVLANPVWAGPKQHWHDDDDRRRAQWSNDGRHADDDDHDEDCRLHARDVVIIREYYVPRHHLPPGQAKKYYRTGRMPRGWYRRVEPIPVVVERRLPPPPRGYRRGIFDGHVVIYHPRTHVVVDIAALF